MDNKKEQTELKATNIISLFHPKKQKTNFLVKKAGRHFGFLKKAGRHEKGAGRRALQKRPRQNTAIRCRYRHLTPRHDSNRALDNGAVTLVYETITSLKHVVIE